MWDKVTNMFGSDGDSSSEKKDDGILKGVTDGVNSKIDEMDKQFGSIEESMGGLSASARARQSQEGTVEKGSPLADLGF